MQKDKYLSTPIRYIKGVGPSRSKLLSKLGIETIKDALYFLPYRYEDRSSIKKIIDLRPNDISTIVAKVKKITIKQPKSFNQKLKILELTLTDSSGVTYAKWFNQPFLEKVFKINDEIVLYGQFRLNYWHTALETINPEYEILDTEEPFNEQINIHIGRIVPIYRLTNGLSQRQIRNITYTVLLDNIEYIEDSLPKEIIQSQGLPDLRESIKNLHYPPNDISVEKLNNFQTKFHQRLIFDELFFFQVGLALIKKKEQKEKGISFNYKENLINQLLVKLPFNLTNAQQRVFKEITNDMTSPFPMNRLIQGDVGSGKTIVALLSMLLCVENGYQAVLMAPTEILAEQHFTNISNFLKDIDVKVQLITGSKKLGLKKKIEDAIDTSKANIIVGTHALIQENIRFEKLGLVVIDEQHRFGVIQRATLRKKGFNPDTIVMTATPIPRTLALTLYGDLDYSIIDELPPNRSPIKTILLDKRNENLRFNFIKEEIAKGRQVYVIYPLIEESEKVDLESAIEGAQGIQKRFPNLSIGLLHGKMKAEERQATMEEFKNGKIHILVSTTVVEVGVDVSNATLMIIMNAERFGLAQLHQLRGRVGRGSNQSYCILVQHKTNEDARRRLSIMTKTNNGFLIAEEDLKIRGHGEFLGTKQSGLPEFKIANLPRDAEILTAARNEAFSLVDKNSSIAIYTKLNDSLRQFWGDRFDLLKVG
ncbi:MAG: ATP-dependent DNA helicase RecG [Thermodesulfovibrionales bacterium]|nr:ATP-dependent DNA helicase RecG [Thermodesulfovibrionales bacterium]